MATWVDHFSSQRPYRDLFWFCAHAFPLAALLLIALLFVPSWRRQTALGLLVCVAGALIATIAFHYNYALRTWGGHAGAIRDLDRAAFFSGFTASAVAYALTRAGWAAAARFRRR